MAWYEIFDCRTGGVVETVLCTEAGAILRATVWGPQYDCALCDEAAS